MTPDKQKSLDAMRTFARDVEREQGGKPAPTPATPTKTTPAVSEQKPEKPKEDNHKELVTESKSTKKPRVENVRHPKQIPPFHELQKVVKTNIHADPKNQSTPKKAKGITPAKPVSGGTVITDNKKDRPSFFAELKRSLQSWIKNVKKSLTPKSKHTYAVTTTERRKGVVQKATSKTGTMFSADSETLREQIKARQRAEKNEHDDINWSPYTETGYPLLEGEESESADPRVTKISVTQKTHTTQKPVIKSTEKIPELQPEPPELELENPPAPTPTAPEPVEEKVTEEAPETADTTTGTPIVEESEIDDEVEQLLKEAVDEETWQLENVSLKDTNTLAMLLVGVVLGVSIIGFVLVSMFDVGRSNQTEATPQPEQTLYTGALLKEIVLVNQTFNELVASINSTLITEPEESTIEYRFLNSRQQLLPGVRLMNLIKTNVNDGFIDSITIVHFINTAENERALLLASSDPTTARGGMLNWEDTLLADVGPLLDVTNVPPSAGSFTDTQLGSLDVRALVFDGKPLLVYAVVNNTEIIIANDITVLTPFSQN